MSVSIGQHFMIGLSGLSLTVEERKFIVDNEISGVTLFGRNLKEPEQVFNLCQEIKDLSKQTKNQYPLFIGVDMEGGRVRRLRHPYTEWPALAKVGIKDDPNLSQEFSYRMGLELCASGINLDYAPCTDVLTNPSNTAIGDRSLSTSPTLVAKHVPHLISGYQKANIITCSKHFPGHGNTILDSHYDLPIENRSLDQLNECEFIAFQSAIQSGVDMMMMAHIRYQKIDPVWPATLSKIFIEDILKTQLGFSGLVITDDLGMKAMADNFGVDEIPVRALEAGNDLLLYCNEPEVPPIALESVKKAIADRRLDLNRLESSCNKILNFKKNWFTKDRIQAMQKTQLLRSQLVGSQEHKNIITQL